MKRISLAIKVSLVMLSVLNNVYADSAGITDTPFSYDDNITIPTLQDPENAVDGAAIYLPANIYVPAMTTPGQLFPAIVFVNSWGADETEYGPQAETLVKKGYVVLRYTTRGFHGSPEYIDTAGNKDIADASNAITFLVDNYPVDPAKIAIGGTSYGSGISLITAMKDERVAAVIATSTWGSLKTSLWANETPKNVWINLLMASSENPDGNRDPEIEKNLENLHNHENIDATMAWALERSPLSYESLANARANKPAIYVANSLHDYLFHPNSIVEFLENYQGPWHADFSFGTHAGGEMSGLMGKDEESFVWQNAYAWLDHYLKDENNYIDAVKKVSVRVKSTTGQARDSFSGLPVNDDVITYFADPLSGSQGGELNLSGTWNADTPSTDSGYDTVWTGGVSGATWMSARYYRLEDIDPRGALIYTSPVLSEAMFLRGAPVLTFSAYVQHNTQFFAYLLDLNPVSGEAHWIGHGPLTWHRPEGATEDPAEPVSLSLEMFWTAHDIAAGHQLVLVVDGADEEYYRYDDTPVQNQWVIDVNHPMAVEIPVISYRHSLDTMEIQAAKAEKEAAEAENGDRNVNGEGPVYGPGGGAWNGLILAGLSMFIWCRRNVKRKA